MSQRAATLVSMSTPFVPVHRLGDSVLVEGSSFQHTAYIHDFRACRFLRLEGSASSSLPLVRRAVVRRVREIAESGEYAQLIDCFQEVVAAHAWLSDRPGRPLLQVFGREGRAHAMVLEHPAGPALDTLVLGLHDRGQRVPAAVALAVAHPLVRMWEHAGSIRPDVALEDVFLSPGGRVCVAFHMDQDNVAVDTSGGSLGRYALYYPPELRRTEPRNQVYQLGALLYEILVGGLFMRIQSIPEWRAMSLAGLPSIRTRRPDLPMVVAAFVDRAVALDPCDRFASWSELGHELEVLRSMLEPMGPPELEAWLQSLPAELRPSGPPLELDAFGDWQSLPRLAYEPVPIPLEEPSARTD